MAKRFLKQNARTQSDDAGCLSGFIGIFDFRVQHYSQKLLSDRKRSKALATGYSRKKLDFPSTIAVTLEEIDASLHKDDDKIKAKKGTPGLLSVKTLMEEEMSRTQNAETQNNKLEHSQSESEHGIYLKEKNKKKSKKKCNDLASSTAQFSFDSEINSLSLPEIITHREKIHPDDNDSKLSGTHLILQKALDDAANVFLSQKLVDSNELISNMAFQSKEFMDALEILSSNEELLVNLIQDQSLTLLRHIQDIQDTIGSEIIEETSTSAKIEVSVTSELLSKQNHHNFFRKKEKLKGSDISQSKSKIVVLEPSPVKIQNDSVTQILSSSPLSHHRLKHQEGIITKSYLSMKAIKKKLRHVIGENKTEQHPIPTSRLLDKISYGFKDFGDTRKGVVLANKSSCSSQDTSQLSAVGKKREKAKLKIEHPQHRDSLNEMLTVRDEKDSSPTASKSLERVVSLRECNLVSPRLGRENNKELVLPPRKIIFPPSQQVIGEVPVDHLSPPSKNFHQDAKMCLTELNEECVAGASKLKVTGSIEILETSDIKLLEEQDELVALSESIGNEPGVLCEVCEEEGLSPFGELKTPDNKPLVIPSFSISPGFLQIGSSENSDCILEKPDKPSPVSVLEPFFLEDTVSPGSTTANHVDLPLQHQKIDSQEHNHSMILADSEGQPLTCIDKKEAIFGFITTLLQASGMNHSQILDKHNPSNKFLDPSLLEEAGTLYNILPDVANLLFDCINEVLAEIKKRLFSCTSWIYLIKPSSQVILKGTYFIQEVYNGIDRHLQLSESTLDEFARKDLEGRSWMDLRLDIEEIVFEIADAILDEIIEENRSKT